MYQLFGQIVLKLCRIAKSLLFCLKIHFEILCVQFAVYTVKLVTSLQNSFNRWNSWCSFCLTNQIVSGIISFYIQCLFVYKDGFPLTKISNFMNGPILSTEYFKQKSRNHSLSYFLVENFFDRSNLSHNGNSPFRAYILSYFSFLHCFLYRQLKETLYTDLENIHQPLLCSRDRIYCFKFPQMTIVNIKNGSFPMFFFIHNMTVLALSGR